MIEKEVVGNLVPIMKIKLREVFSVIDYFYYNCFMLLLELEWKNWESMEGEKYFESMWCECFKIDMEYKGRVINFIIIIFGHNYG